ncbi:MAG: hypothetical protein A2081_01665 [Elusimicrobia bacterium GWC2_61_19]|nr:MAG: hypothetical protein A2081_01665 [Elusimicrobia bacterium GWC2_61_19]
MYNKSFAFAILFILTTAPGQAGQEPQPEDSEQLSQDMIKNIDGWLGRINAKIQADKPVTAEDFDPVFGDSFLSGSEDPVRDLELAQRRIDSKLGGDNKKVSGAYGKWAADKLAPADLAPSVVRDDEHVTVDLKTPGSAADSMKINVDRSRIKLDYDREESQRITHPDGSVTSESFMKRRSRMMAVPKGANPAKYRVQTSKGLVSIIFDRKKGKTTEASK